MVKLAELLTDYIVRKEVIANDEYENYKYGFLTGFELIFSLLTCIVIGVLLHMTIECAIFLLIFIALRTYAGGIHLYSYAACFICSCLVMTSALIGAEYINISPLLSYILIAIFTMLINIIGPVDNRKHSESTEEIRYYKKKLRNNSIFILVLAALFVIIGLNKYVILIAITIAFVFISMLLNERVHLKTS